MDRKLTIIAVTIVVAVILLIHAIGQVGISGSTLAACSAANPPKAGVNQICSVANDPSNPDGYYVSFNGGQYQNLQSLKFPASFTCNFTDQVGQTGGTITLSSCH